MINLFIHAAMLTTTPILLAAIGGFVNRMGGLVNLGLESMMLAGALVAVEVSAATGSAMLATVAAAMIGAFVGLLMSLIVTRLRANEIIVGLGFSVAVAGLVRFILKSAYGASGTYNPPGVAMLPRLDVPVLDGVPILGALLSQLDPLTWLAWALVPAVAFALARTRSGLRLRATGAAEATVRSVGLAPLAIRDASTVFAGALSGLAGAHLSIGIVGLFNEGITGGRGFIALAAFYFGRASAFRTALGALLFGVFDAAQIRLQGRGVPAEIVQTLPYCHRHRRLDRPRVRRPALEARRDAVMIERASDTPNPPTALILVDVINSFFLEGMPNQYPEAADVLPALRRLLSQARSAGRLVVHAVERHYPGFDDHEWRKLPRHHLVGDPDAAFFEGFAPAGPREIVCPKRRYSAFFATDLALFLQRAEDRARHRRRRQDQRLHTRDGAGRLRLRVRGRRAERGDEFQSPAPRRSVARGHRALFRRRRFARTRARDAGMSIVVTGYASLDYAVRLELGA